MLSLNGNTAPYLLYTLVRIAGIKRKNDFVYDSKDFQYANYEHKSEWKLIRKLLKFDEVIICLLYTSPSPRDRTRSRMPSSA